MGASKDSVPVKNLDMGPTLYTNAKDVPEPKPGEKVFYVVGHSWVDGMGHSEQKNKIIEKALHDKGENVRIVFVGKIGSSAKWAQEQLKILEQRGMLDPKNCAGVAIVTGTNDLYSGRNLDATAKIIKEMSNSVAAKRIPTYVFNAPCHKNDPEISERANRLNKKLNENGVKNIIDLHGFTEKKKYYGKHPPTKGYSEIATELILNQAILPSLGAKKPEKPKTLQFR